MKNRRRLVFQLTPLLDLLLIVIFLQFVEVRERESTTLQAARQVLEQGAELEADLARVRSEYDSARDAQQESETRNSQLADENTGLQSQIAGLQSEVARLQAEQQHLGQLVQELFNIPATAIAKVLTPTGATRPAASAEQLAELESSFQEFASRNPARMIRHIFAYEEMRKRCDLWELHIDDSGRIMLWAGGQEHEFRATSPEEFSDRFYAIYKSLPEPKSLVVILLSYGDARADVREAALQGLPQVTDRMWRHAGGMIRFEYAVLGFQPKPEH